MSCLHHGQIGKLKAPTVSSKIYKEECTLCFTTPDNEGGVDVCLTCFNGGCTPTDTGHAVLHYRKTGHCLVLNVRREPGIEADPRAGAGREPAAKVTKVEVAANDDGAESPVQPTYAVRCLACTASWPTDAPELADAQSCLRSVIASTSASKKVAAASQAWQEEVVICEHARGLLQSFDPIACRLQAKDRCGQCDLRQNLWMCLTCGVIGCGRTQYDGSGGRGHGAAHFATHQHPLAIKLGTIGPEGRGGDVHCYVCNELCVDPQLSVHLAALGIDVASVEQTEATMAELQLEQNLKFDFSMVTEDGRELEAVHGAGLTGLKNLGNSCYLNAVLQSLFHLSPFRSTYGGREQQDDGHQQNGGIMAHQKSCHKDSPACFVCQAEKLGTALERGDPPIISPWMFKAVVSTGHLEFASARQQDASEFLAYLLKVIQRSDPVSARGLVDAFVFSQQQRLSCAACGSLRKQCSSATQLSLQLSDVLASPLDNFTIADRLQLDHFLGRYFEAELVEARCDRCGGPSRMRSMALLTFPRYLIITLSRFVVRDWVPQKFDMAVEVPFSGLQLGRFQTSDGGEGNDVEGGEGGESGDLAGDSDAASAAVDQAVLGELVAMGFPPAKSRRALVETGNAGLEMAMNWILENEDLAADEVGERGGPPSAGIATATGAGAVSEEMVGTLMEAGFSRTQAVTALRQTDGNMERAFDWILSHPEGDGAGPEAADGLPKGADGTRPSSGSTYDLVAFISHKGPSLHCGHYIAHVRHPERKQWVMFNDERVVLASPQPPTAAAEKAYIYIYERR